MRKSINVFGILIVLLLISCEREAKNEVLADSPFHAIKDGKEWITTSCWANHLINEGRFVIVGINKDPKYNQEEQLLLIFETSDFPMSNTVTNINNSKWWYVIGGDAISNKYLIDSTYNNFIKIDSLDIINKRIAGTFKIKLIRDISYSNLGETILFDNGVFALNYKLVQ
jgi:hypothetical protein